MVYARGCCTRPLILSSYISASESGASNMYHYGVTYATNPYSRPYPGSPDAAAPFYFLPSPCLPTNNPISFQSSPMPFQVTIRLVPGILTRTQRRINARHHALLYSESYKEKERQSSFICQVKRKKKSNRRLKARLCGCMWMWIW